MVSYPCLKGARIFIVEVDGFLATLIEEMLAELGCVGSGVATSVEAALSAFQKPDKFDCIILDIRLGVQLSSEIASELIAWEIPFIFCSGYDISLPGMNIPTITRPFTTEALAEALAKAMTR